VGSIDASQRLPVTRLASAALTVLIPVVIVATCASGGVSLRGYPVGALDWMDQHGLLASDLRVAEEDYVGNLLELRYGVEANAFIDDRYELHTSALVDDYTTLKHGLPGWSSVLDRYGIDVVVWHRDSPLGALLLDSPAWRVAYDDETAVVPSGPDHAERVAIAKAKPFIVACRPTVTRCVTNPPEG
jgi:hypothetical protein